MLPSFSKFFLLRTAPVLQPGEKKYFLENDYSDADNIHTRPVTRVTDKVSARVEILLFVWFWQKFSLPTFCMRCQFAFLHPLGPSLSTISTWTVRVADGTLQIKPVSHMTTLVCSIWLQGFWNARDEGRWSVLCCDKTLQLQMCTRAASERKSVIWHSIGHLNFF